MLYKEENQKCKHWKSYVNHIQHKCVWNWKTRRPVQLAARTLGELTVTSMSCAEHEVLLIEDVLTWDMHMKGLYCVLSGLKDMCSARL